MPNSLVESRCRQPHDRQASQLSWRPSCRLASRSDCDLAADAGRDEDDQLASFHLFHRQNVVVGPGARRLPSRSPNCFDPCRQAPRVPAARIPRPTLRHAPVGDLAVGKCIPALRPYWLVCGDELAAERGFGSVSMVTDVVFPLHEFQQFLKTGIFLRRGEDVSASVSSSTGKRSWVPHHLVHGFVSPTCGECAPARLAAQAAKLGKVMTIAPVKVPSPQGRGSPDRARARASQLRRLRAA